MFEDYCGLVVDCFVECCCGYVWVVVVIVVDLVVYLEECGYVG